MDNRQPGCVLMMMLRDKTEGTTHHRRGGSGNQILADLHSVVQPPAAAGILAMIEQSSILFDELAARWSDTYTDHRRPLLAQIRHAEKEMG
jgi:hypothetical protein